MSPQPLGVNIAIIQNNRILLTLREDFEVWCLPGGGIDPGESFGQAAVREAREELGLDVRLTHLVGLYARPGWHGAGTYVAVFAAEIAGGTMKLQPEEVLEAHWFARHELPDAFLQAHRQRALDALDGLSGIVRAQVIHWPFDSNIPRAEIYAMRDRSGLPRREFYLRTIAAISAEEDLIEVPPTVHIPPLPPSECDDLLS
ncbi:MAG: hypothetical protein Fur0018_15870 [Anaerolineales bacterium]